MQQGKTVAFSSKGDEQKPSNSLEPKSRELSFSRGSAKGTKHGTYNSMYSTGANMKGSAQHWQQQQQQQQQLFHDDQHQFHQSQQFKSTQGFYLNENFTSPLNSFRKTSIQLKNQVHQISQSSSQFFNSTGIAAENNNSNNDSSHLSQYYSKNQKLSQEKVLASFYKKQRDSSTNILLMPDRFWEQHDKDFIPFRQIWADHERVNAKLMHQYEQKKQEQQRMIEEKAQKDRQLEETISRQSSKCFGEQSAKTSARSQVRSQPIIRTPLNFFYYCSTPEVADNGKHIHGRNYFHEQHHQLLEQENRNKLDRLQKLQQIGRKKDKVMTKRHSVHGLLSDTKQQSLHQVSKSPLVSSRLEQMKEKNGDQEHTISQQKEIELTSVQELELQLCQNRFTQEVYDAKILALEWQARGQAMSQIEENHQHAEKMNRKIKVYNKRSIAESIDSPNSQQAHFSSGGSRGMQKRAESMGNLNINSDIDNAALLSLAIKEPEKARPTISYCWIEADADSWRPPPRIGCSINLIGSFGQQLKILLIGGMSSEMVKDVLLIDPENYTYITLDKFEEQRKQEMDNYKDELQKKKALKDRRQSKLQQTRSSALGTDNTRKASASQDVDELFNKYMYGNGGFSQRYNHTAVEIARRTKLLIFGGEIQNFDNANSGRQKLRPHHRNCLNDLISFDLETLEWRGHMGRGEAVEARRNHTANMVGNKHMVVMGGLNSEGRALDDLFILDILTFRWVNICLFHNKYVHAFPQGIAFHSACFVSEDETSTNINIFGGNYFQSAHQPSKDNKKNTNNQVSFSPTFIKEEGLYVFGGIDSQGTYIRNKMFVLKQNGNPPAWIELPTIGKSPDRRCMHTLSFMFSLSLCVVYGGMFESQNSTKYLDDLNILNLKSLEWIQVILEGPRKPGRAMHSACVNHKSLIIFGGLNEIGFVKGNIEILELDQSIVSKMKRLQNFSLSQQQQLIHRRVSKLDETSANAGSQNDKEKQLDQQNQESVFQYTARMKEKVFLIDPEREREINKLHELERQQQDSTEKSKSKPKWMPPAPNTLNSSLSIKHNTNFSSSESQGTRTFLPIPNNKKEF